MLEIIADVVSAEGQHCHRITSHLAHRARRRRSRFRSHGRAQIDAMVPIERLKHKRHRVAAASAENDCADRYAFTLFNVGIERRIVKHGRSKSARSEERRVGKESRSWWWP